MQREIQIISCFFYAFKLTYLKNNEIIKGFEFPAAYLPICFSSNYASLLPPITMPSNDSRLSYFFADHFFLTFLMATSSAFLDFAWVPSFPHPSQVKRCFWMSSPGAVHSWSWQKLNYWPKSCQRRTTGPSSLMQYMIQCGTTQGRFSKTGVSRPGLAISPKRVGRIYLDICEWFENRFKYESIWSKRESLCLPSLQLQATFF